jgi:hypothetical protein
VPLLEGKYFYLYHINIDLGIEIDKIKLKFLSIVTQRGIKETAEYDDMAGPIMVCVLFGILLLCKGKIHFGSIYGFGLTGCIGIYFVLNLMSHKGQYVELYKTISTLGYSLLPFVLLALISIFLDLRNASGAIISIIMLIWSTVTATRLFEYSLDM